VFFLIGNTEKFGTFPPSKDIDMTDSNIDQTPEENVLTLERRGVDRRTENAGAEEGNTENLETGVVENSRRKKQRRRHIDPTTCERDYSNPEIEFMRAMDDYKRDAGRMFPTCSEVLEVFLSLGYYKLTAEEAAELGLDEVSKPDIQETESLSEESDDFIDA
tara:strand:- start:529 stop:1014 length:486 start_codon:yes stop_codon:yes gene_type:complete